MKEDLFFGKRNGQKRTEHNITYKTIPYMKINE
jgi:hypothetical protein